jgi:sRNA-binding regulator protein Hfq
MKTGRMDQRPRRHMKFRSRDGIANSILKSGHPSEQTNAEVMYLTTLIQNKTQVRVQLTNDEEVTGWIEYYDKNFIRLTRDNQPNLFIYKDKIRFIAER